MRRSIFGVYGTVFAGAFALVGFARGAAAAEQVHVEEARGEGVQTETLRTVTELVRSAVSSSGRRLEDDAGSADFTLRPKLLRLGGSFLLSIEKIEGGDSVYTAQLKAARVEELDQVASRVTRAAMDEIPVSSDVRVGEVTETEAKGGSARRPVRRGYYGGFGPMEAANLGTDGIGFYGTAAYGWDVSDVLVKAYADLAAGDEAGMVTAGLAGNFFLNDRDVAPYLGVGLGYGAADPGVNDPAVGSSTTTGFVVSGDVGFHFLRTSSINLDLAFHAGVMLASNPAGNPAVFALRLGLFFPAD